MGSDNTRCGEGSKSHGRYGLVFSVLGVGLSASFAAFLLVRDWSDRELHQAFGFHAKEHIALVEDSVDDIRFALKSLGNVCAQSAEITQRDFAKIVAPVYEHTAGIAAIEWLPRVAPIEHGARKSAAVGKGASKFDLTRLRSAASPIPRSGLDGSLPAKIGGASHEKEAFTGFEPASEAKILEALLRARDMAKIVATEPLGLVRRERRLSVVVFVQPVYRHGDPIESIAQRQMNLQGFVAMVIDTHAMLVAKFASLPPAGLDTWTFDGPAVDLNRLICVHWSRTRSLAAESRSSPAAGDLKTLIESSPTTVGERTWTIACTAAPYFLRSHATWTPWGVFLAALALTALATNAALASVRVKARILRLVDERTRQLQENESLLRSFFDSAGQMRGIVELDGDDTVHIMANLATAKFFARSRESMECTRSRDLGISSDIRRMWIGRLRECQASRKSVTFEYLHVAGTQEHWLWSTVTYLGDGPTGNPRFAHLVQDVTDRKQIESQIRKLSYVVEQCAVSVVITDLEGKIQYVNPKFCSVTGYAPEEAIGKEPRILKSGCTHSGVYRELWETIRSGREWRGELCNRKKDGELFWENTIIAPIRDQSGEISNYVAVKEDITARRRAEEENRKTQARLNCALNIAKTGCWEWDVVNDEILWPGETAGFFGFPITEKRVTLEFFLEYVHADDRGEVAAFVAAAIRSREEREFAIDYRIVRPDGQVRSLRSLGKVVERDEEGAPRCAVGTITDITEQELIRETVRRQSHELQKRQAQRMELVGQLAGGIAHEFNNLLQAISGHASFAIRGLDPTEERHEDIQQVLKAAGRAASLTRQLLGFSRRQVLERKIVGPNEVVRDLVKLVRPVLGEHIAIECALDPDAGNICADAGELQQVLLNLCINSRDAMPDGGTITLATGHAVIDESAALALPNCKAGDYTVIRVTDNGTGIPAEVQGHIFEPFFTTKEVGQGTGLGLSAVQGIVEQHNGVIEVVSAPGRTTFTIYLPVFEAEAADETVSGESSSAPGGEETILVAEDEPIVRNVSARILQQAGYKVLMASDGEEAMRIYEEHRSTISLVLLDAVMPKLTGHEVCQRIRSADPGAKVVFCSGYTHEEVAAGTADRKNVRLVGKPFTQGSLLNAIREVLDEEIRS